MLYVNIPTREELLALSEMRSDICLSIYITTTPLTQAQDASRIELKNILKDAIAQLSKANYDKKRIASLEEQITNLSEQEDFWVFHAHTLGILATPDSIRSYRLANSITNQMEISDRFHLKPLFRALTFPHHAYVLALSENDVRLIEFFPSSAPEEIRVPNMPKNALDAVGKATLTSSLSSLAHESGSKGYKARLFSFARKVDEALKPRMLQNHVPLILASTEPLLSMYKAVSSTNNLATTEILTSPDRLSTSELVELARPILDNHYEQKIKTVKELFEERTGQDRVVLEISSAAKAATYGMISLLLVDFDKVVTGFIDDSGTVSYSDKLEAYGLIDEIAKRALAAGAEVLAVRKEDMIGDCGVAGILRYSF